MEDVLTSEGQKMWDNLSSLTAVKVKKPRQVKLSKIVFNTDRVELDFFKGEIVKLILNSELVIQDCDLIMKKYITMEEYIASEPKIAKTIHMNLIERLERMLNYLPAFKDESHLTQLL